MKTTFIYTLEFPEGNIRYVGKSNNPERRLKGHLLDSRSKTYTHKQAWINGLVKSNEIPILSIIDEVPADDWTIYEQYWISQFKCWGFDLVNSTIGGDGYLCTNPDVIDRMRKTLKRKYDSGEIVVWNKGMKGIFSGEDSPNYGIVRTPDQREVQRKIKLDYYKTNEVWNKGMTGYQGAWNKGLEWSEETKEKMKSSRREFLDKGGEVWNKGISMSEETKNKLSKALTGTKKKVYRVVCPHCGLEGWSNAMKRWHFSYCKHKKVEVLV